MFFLKKFLLKFLVRRKLCRDFNLNKIIKLNSLEEALVISNLIMDAVEKRCSKDFAELIIAEQLLPIHNQLIDCMQKVRVEKSMYLGQEE